MSSTTRSPPDLTEPSDSPAPRAILLDEVLRHLAPRAGGRAVDCTLGEGAHTRQLLERVEQSGRVLGLDVDPVTLDQTQSALRRAGFGPPRFVARHQSFARLPEAMLAVGMPRADMVLADLGVCLAQLRDASRGFSYKAVGPLDMRLDPTTGEPAAELVARSSAEQLATLLVENSDEPHAELIAALLKERPLTTTHHAERHIREGLLKALPHLPKAEVKKSLRRTFQALRIAVNDELGALDALLRALPECLAPGGRVVIITFHSGEDRRVKKAFSAGLRAGVYAEVAARVVRPSKAETFADRRVASAKLRWAIAAPPGGSRPPRRVRP